MMESSCIGYLAGSLSGFHAVSLFLCGLLLLSDTMLLGGLSLFFSLHCILPEQTNH